MGITVTSYTIFKDFKKKILKPYCDYTTERTDILVNYKGVREGGARKFTHIAFITERKAWQLPLLCIPNLQKLAQEINESIGSTQPLLQGAILSPESKQLIESVCDYGVSEKDANEALEKWGEEGMTDILDSFEKIRGRKKIKNPAGYLAKCLHEGYGRKSKHEFLQEVKAKEAKELAQKEQEMRKQLEEKAKKVVSAYHKYIRNVGKRMVNSLTKKDLQEYETKIFRQKSIMPKFWWEEWDKEGTFHEGLTELIKNIYYETAARVYSTTKEIDFSEYCKREEVTADVLSELVRQGKISIPVKSRKI